MKIIIRSKYPTRLISKFTNLPINQTKGGEKRMRYSKIILALGVVAFVLATLITSWAAEDVRNSKHNLSTNPNILATGTTEVCVFCHTPHGGDTTVGGGAAPIWNRSLSTATYTQVYTSPNFDAVGTTPGTPKGVSVACLSCHDGTVAFDSLFNFGGSGSTDTINFTGPYVDADNSFKETDRSAGGPSPYPNLGTNLSNDHPISMEIPCGLGGDPQFTEICGNLNPSLLTANKVSPIYRGDVSTLPTDKRDQLRAYPTVPEKAYIECASCHNPHENTSTRFLRYPSFVGTADETAVGGASALNADRNAGSLLCLSCHQK